MKLYEVFGIRHHWLKWAETAEGAIRQVLEDEPEAAWELGREDVKDCEEVPLPLGYKLVKDSPPLT